MARGESAGDRITKEATVSEALNHAASVAVVVRGETALREIAAAASEHPAVRVICVVDEDQKLIGLIRVNALCDDLYFHVTPEEFISEILERGKIDEFGRFARARVASDLMEAATSVVGEDTLATAFARLHDRGLDGLPVVDPSGRPIAYLDRLRLIVVWLETHPSSGAV